MSKTKEVIGKMSDKEIKNYYDELLVFEKTKALADDSIVREFVKNHYEASDSMFMMSVIAFSNTLLMEIAKRYYNE